MAYTLDPYALTTLARAKQHLNIQNTDTSQDDIVTRFINAATYRIENYCDRKFKRRQFTEFYSGRNQNQLIMRQWPCEKPSELWIDSTSAFTDVTRKLATTDYELTLSAKGEGIGVILLGGTTFSRGTRNVKAIYYAGFSDIPADIEDVCLWLVEFFVDMKSDRRIGTKQKGKNNESIVFADDLPGALLATLDRYARMEFCIGETPIESM